MIYGHRWSTTFGVRIDDGFPFGRLGDDLRVFAILDLWWSVIVVYNVIRNCIVGGWNTVQGF